MHTSSGVAVHGATTGWRGFATAASLKVSFWGAILVFAALPWSTAGFSFGAGLLLMGLLLKVPFALDRSHRWILLGSSAWIALLAVNVVAQNAGVSGWDEIRSYYPLAFVFSGLAAPVLGRRLGMLITVFLVSVTLAAASSIFPDASWWRPDGVRFHGTVGIVLYGYVLPLAMLFAVWLVTVTKRWSMRAILMGTCLVLIHAMAVNGTRTGLLAGVLFMPLVFFAAPDRRLVAGLVAIVMVVGAWMLSGSQLASRFVAIVGEEQVSYTMDEREALWMAGWETFMQNPIVGCGPGLFRSELDALQDSGALSGAKTVREVHSTAHSNPLHLLATQGIVGLALFLAWVAAVLRALVVARPGRTAMVVALVALGYFLLFGLAHTTLDNSRMFGVTTLLVGCALAARADAGGDPHTGGEARGDGLSRKPRPR